MNVVERELAQVAHIPPIRIADLIMMQMLGDFDRFLEDFASRIDYDRIQQSIAQTRTRATSEKLYKDFARKMARQQFGDSAAALRELTQNGIDAYSLAEVHRRVVFCIDEDGDHTVVRAQDFGVAMSLRDIARFLLIPYNTTKDRDFHKIGQHGVGWFSVIGISDLVKVRSRKRGTDTVAQVILKRREHDVEALLSNHDADMQDGTEVMLCIPRGVKNMDRASIQRQLSKYVGYVDPLRAEITLDGTPINTLPAEYLTGLPGDVTINGEAKPLIFSFSKRALRAAFRDERFDERNKNLQHVVYTQSGLFVKYGCNPFAQGTIHHSLFSDLIQTGLDFWIQLPEGVGLTIGRNDLLPEYSNEVLEASYEAFRSLFLESIITDDEILYHPSQALERGIAEVLRSGRYLDHARSEMVRQYSLKRRLLSRIMPLVAGAVNRIYVGGKFLLTAPLRLAYYCALAPVSLSATAIRSFAAGGYKTLGKSLAAGTLAGALVYGGYKLYTTDWTRPVELAMAPAQTESLSQREPFSRPFLGRSPADHVSEPVPHSGRPLPSSEDASEGLKPIAPPDSGPDISKLATSPEPAPAELASAPHTIRPELAQSGDQARERTPSPPLDERVRSDIRATRVQGPPQSDVHVMLRRALAKSSAALHLAKDQLVNAPRKGFGILGGAKEGLEELLSSVPDPYRSPATNTLLGLGLALSLLGIRNDQGVAGASHKPQSDRTRHRPGVTIPALSRVSCRQSCVRPAQ